jgi:hypothetical protein
MSLRARFTPAPSAPSAEEAESRAAALLAQMRGRAGWSGAPKAANAAAKVVRPLLSKSAGVGFSELKRRWAEFVGEPFGSKAEPVSLARGVVTVRAPSSIAPFLQHQEGLVLERLRLAGVKAEGLRIEQRALMARSASKPRPSRRALSPAEESALAQELDRIGDDGLKSALLRLGRAVKQS